MNIPPLKNPELFWNKIYISEGCWNWLGSRNTKGYGQFSINRHPYKAHRIMWREYFGEIPEGLCILHKCDNPSCVNPDHLFLGTYKDNTQDMLSKGRHYYQSPGVKEKVCKKGEDSPFSVLTEKQVIEIRQLEGKLSTRKIAELYKIGQTTVRHILCRRTWKHLP